PASHGQTPRAGAAPPVRSDDARLEQLAANPPRDPLKYRATPRPVPPPQKPEPHPQKELGGPPPESSQRGAIAGGASGGGKRAVAAAQKDVDDTRQAMAEADRMMGEARMADVGRTRPLARGQYEETAGLVRFAGLTEWSLAADTPKLELFFRNRFGRALPISAFGQTALHDRLGFHRRNALDVPLHPDSPEGRALRAYLRANGIPFIAAWGIVPGQTSGAHIHVGQPSPRLLARR